MKNTNKPTNYITFINVIAAIAVLTLHTNHCFWEFSTTESYWKSANVVECIFYPAVPLFFMISGITLMDFYDRYTLKEFFIKRLNKAVIPFIAWSLIAVLERLVRHKITLGELSFKYIYQGITGTTFVDIYGFFSSLFIIYLCMPLFAAVEKSKRKLVFSYLVVVGFVLNQLIPFIKVIFNLDFNAPYSVTVISGVLIWPLLGWLLHNCELDLKKRLLLYLAAIAGLLMHIIGTYSLSMEQGVLDSTYKGYENVPSVLYAAGMFMLLKEIGSRIMAGSSDKTVGKTAQFFTWLSGYTFSFYLMQIYLLRLFPKLSFINDKSLLYRLGAPYLMMAIMVPVTWCMRKIPIIKRIVP